MWFLHYHYHNNDLLATARRWQLLLMITILVHVGFSEIRTTIPGRDKRPASAGADQPHERLREELTSYDYCEGKLHEKNEKKRSINKGQNFACISVGANQPRKQLCEEFTNHDYCEGKLLTHEKKILISACTLRTFF